MLPFQQGRIRSQPLTVAGCGGLLWWGTCWGSSLVSGEQGPAGLWTLRHLVGPSSGVGVDLRSVRSWLPTLMTVTVPCLLVSGGLCSCVTISHLKGRSGDMISHIYLSRTHTLTHAHGSDGGGVGGQRRCRWGPLHAHRSVFLKSLCSGCSCFHWIFAACIGLVFVTRSDLTLVVVLFALGCCRCLLFLFCLVFVSPHRAAHHPCTTRHCSLSFVHSLS